MAKLVDIYVNECHVQDIQAFKEHIIKYHTYNGEPDGSIHEENGYWFKVTDEFYKKVMSL